VLDGGGVIVPEGGTIGALNSLKFLGVLAEQDWLAVGVGVPAEVVADAVTQREAARAEPGPPPIDESVLPPAFALDEDLDSYPTGL
jgi:hypothetical protein